jgi:14-3-3 protein epsilon
MEAKIFMARVAEQSEKFDDMVKFIKDFIKEKDTDFTIEERNLLSVGFKNLIGGIRAALRTIAAIEPNPKYSKYSEGLGTYKKRIESELKA